MEVVPERSNATPERDGPPIGRIGLAQVAGYMAIRSHGEIPKTSPNGIMARVVAAGL